MHKTLSFNNYLLKIFAIAILFVVLPMIFGCIDSDSSLASFLISCCCFFILFIISTKLILEDNRLLKFYALSFVFQLAISVLHYLIFVDSSYFEGDGGVTPNFWHEFITTIDSVGRIHDYWKQYGLFSMLPVDDYATTHREMWHIIAWPFYFLDNKWLNYGPFNTFSSLFASVNLVFLYRFKLDVQSLKYLRWWSAFFPLFLFNDWMWRDAFGILLISIGLVCCSLAHNPISKLISFFILGISSYLQRTMYLVLAGASVGYSYICKQKNLVFRMFELIFTLILVVILLQYAQDANETGYSAGYVNSMSILALPIKIIFGLIGPFPWFIFPDLVEKNPAFAWQLSDYLLGTFQLGYLFSLVLFRSRVSFTSLDLCTIMGFGIMFSGFMTTMMHISYISEGLYFTLPWFFYHIGSKYKIGLRISFLMLVLLNILIICTGNLSISSFWK